MTETFALPDVARDAVRDALLAKMREWSEDNYCAGWLIDLEVKLHKEAGEFETLGRLVGWPIGPDAEGGWETWQEATQRYAANEAARASWSAANDPAPSWGWHCLPLDEKQAWGYR